jgi:hypothetical protein
MAGSRRGNAPAHTQLQLTEVKENDWKTGEDISRRRV